MNYEKHFEDLHRKNIITAQDKAKRIFDYSTARIAQLLYDYAIRNPESFTFSKDKILYSRVLKELGTLNTNINKLVVEHSVISWGLSNQKNDFLTRQYLRNIKYSGGIKADYFNSNIKAMNAFINRTEQEMNLSKRIWRLTDNYKNQLEAYIVTGTGTGRSAAKLSRDVRQLLIEPDKLFRRVRNETGKFVLSKAAKAYKPGAGAGIYRSSYKNAMRLTVSETNMAYRMADYERRKENDYVAGIKVHLSRSHPRPDICDHLQGDYPKDFVFRGWHPWCLCFTTSILMSGSEFKRMQESSTEPKRKVKDIPTSAKEYVKEHSEAFKNMKTKPYFIQDNKGLYF